MKKLKIILIIVSSVLIACEPLEVEVKNAFEFEIVSEYDSENIIGKTIDTKLEIIPEKSVGNTKYFLSYEVLSGEGYYKLGNTVLSENQEYSLNDNTFSLQYVGDNAEDHKVKLIIRDNYNQVKEHLLTYVIIDKTDFNVTIVPEEHSDYVKDFTTFHFNIEKEGNEDLTYSMTFSGQYGEFQYSGNRYITGQQINGISEGAFQMDYRANEITNKDIEITITASNGISKTIEVEYESVATDFEIVITPNAMSRLYVFPQTFEMSIIPPPVDDYRLEYTMYYTSTIGTVSLDFHDIDILGFKIPGIVMDFGINTYTSGNVKQIGSVGPREGELTFVFTDSNGVTNSKTVSVEWTDHVFEE